MRWTQLHLVLLMISPVYSCQKSEADRRQEAVIPAQTSPVQPSPQPSKSGAGDIRVNKNPKPISPPNPLAKAQNPRYFAYVGGSSNAIGIYQFNATTGTLQTPNLIPMNGAVTSFMAFHPSRPWVYVSNESGTGGVISLSINPETGELTRLNDIPASGPGPTHVSIDTSGKYVLSANYNTGEVKTFAIGADGRLGPAITTEFAGLNAHQILSSPFTNTVYVHCLGANLIAQYTFNKQTGSLSALSPASLNVITGGPRHLAFHPKKAWAYLIKELNSTVQALSIEMETGQLKLLGTAVSTRPVGASQPNTGAEIQVDSSGSYVYVSNRGDNTLALFTVNSDGTLSFKSATPSGALVPRHFSISPAGDWILSANQESGTVSVLKIDRATGALLLQKQTEKFAGAQFVQVIDLNQYRQSP
ncbi:MAG: lactonase family protein [Proteobacteria bacterium]|nr:lactonase family protein [Pseudomonadota bacterium]